MTILAIRHGGPDSLPEYQGYFAEFAPHIEVRHWDDAALDPAQVSYALLWGRDPGRLARMTNLRAIFSPGAGVVNAGRGPQLVLADLIAALDTGHLHGAFLDVFDPEPPPPAHAVWKHPRIIMTPHNAAFDTKRERSRYVAQAILAHERGEALPNLYQPQRGY